MGFNCGIVGLPIEELQGLIRDVPKPVIARVNGFAIGGGNVLATLCDLTIAADTAQFGQVGPKVGSVDAGWGTAFLARHVGDKKAREIWYINDRYSAEQAREILADALLADIDTLVAELDGGGAREEIARLLNVDRKHPITVEGNTDNQRIQTSQFPSNWELSAFRATTVLRYLVAHGVTEQRLSAAGYADLHPLASNATATGRARNRRVDIVLDRIYPGRVHFDLEGGVGTPSRWNTLCALRVLKWWDGIA